jgi:integrase
MALDLPSNMRRRGSILYARVSYKGKELERSLETHLVSEAKRKLKGVLDEMRAEARKPPPEHTMGDLIETFRRTHVARLRDRSAQRYDYFAKQWGKHFGLDMPLSTLTMNDIIAYEAARNSAGIAASTIRLELNALSGLLRHGEDIAWTVKNFVPAFMRTKSRTLLRHDAQRTRYLSKIEEEQAIAYLKAQGREDDADLVAFAIDTGLRRQEQFGSRWSAWDRERREIIVTEQLAKNHKLRRVPLLPRAEAILTKLYEKHNPLPSDCIFNPKDQCVPPQRAQQITQRLLKGGIEDLTWHDLRRTCGCRLLQDYRMEPVIVSGWLGHAHIGITMKIYAFLSKDALHEALARSLKGRVALGEI